MSTCVDGTVIKFAIHYVILTLYLYGFRLRYSTWRRTTNAVDHYTVIILSFPHIYMYQKERLQNTVSISAVTVVTLYKYFYIFFVAIPAKNNLHVCKIFRFNLSIEE